jgi:uncharacterized protein YaiE (UPF0345 family)
MFKTNEYFEGKVKSIAFETNDGPATIGVMAIGEYEFSTSSKEYMTVTSGKMTVKLPGKDEWEEIQANQTFIVEPNEKFQVKIKEETSYICLYK